MYGGFDVPVVKFVLSHFVEYFLLLSYTVLVVDNILLHPCLCSSPALLMVFPLENCPPIHMIEIKT
jgi:hypothetical protein